MAWRGSKGGGAAIVFRFCHVGLLKNPVLGAGVRLITRQRLPRVHSPPSALGRGSPSSRVCLRQRLTLAALTPKRAAAMRWLNPSATAARTRTRRSRESAFDMSAGLLHGRQGESQTGRLGNPLQFSQRGSRSSRCGTVVTALRRGVARDVGPGEMPTGTRSRRRSRKRSRLSAGAGRRRGRSASAATPGADCIRRAAARSPGVERRLKGSPSETPAGGPAGVCGRVRVPPGHAGQSPSRASLIEASSPCRPMTPS